MDNSKPVDHPDRETVAVRQGTGPRATVSVLLVSLLLATGVGLGFIGYFSWIKRGDRASVSLQPGAISTSMSSFRFLPSPCTTDEVGCMAMHAASEAI